MNRILFPTLLVAALVASGCSKTKPDCQGTAANCGGTCFELRSDNLNCGACGNACAPGTVCSQGVCGVTCAAGLVNCGGSCVDPLTSTAHCGTSSACSGGTDCPPGQQCGGGSCSCPAEKPNVCGSGATAFCTEVLTDPENCGSCGTTCGPGKVCSAGSCVQSCSASQATACPPSSPTYCANTQVDANNCGSCGNACPPGQQCSGGTCSCPPTTPDACTTGGGGAFCTKLLLDPQNCGTCGTSCAAGTACSSGTCVTSCPAGEYACAGECIDPQSDPNYCGAASDCAGGSVCGAGTACVHGICSPACEWTSVASYPLDVAPPGSVQKNGGLGGQGVGVVGGRTAWNQTSDWNMLFVPAGLGTTDDVFAIATDVYIGAPTTTALYANQMLFTTTATASGPSGTCQAIGGLYPALAARSGSPSTVEWWSSASCPYVQMTTTPLTSTPSGQWHRYRVEGVRSTCRFRALLDGAPLSTWTGTCDVSGGYFSLYAHAYTLGTSAQVAWSNMVIYKGSAAYCVP